MATKKNAAIIGSGWAGFTLAHALSLAKYNVFVISPTRTIQYTPLLASAAAGMFNFRLAEEPVRRRNLTHGLAYYKASVESIDFDRKRLHCKPSVQNIADQHLHDEHDFTLDYDKLVLAPGCDIETFGTPGALEHSFFLRTTEDAHKIQQRILEMVDAATIPGISDAHQRDILRIIVVGGGAIGMEATAELYDLWHDELRHVYPHLDGKLSIEVHDVADSLLGTFDQKLGEYATQKLSGRGVKIETRSHIEKVEPGAIWTKERGEIKYGLLIWATGNGVSSLVNKLDVKKSGRLQRISTDGHLRVLSRHEQLLEDVYAIGDAADIEGYSLPTLAEVAVQKAQYLANNLNTEASDPRAATEAFKYKQKPNLAYLGQHDGVIGGEQEWMTGHSAWLAWRSGSIYHWPRSWRRTLMMGISWLFNSVGGRDIARKW
ncbi:hypothetical protein CERZMDRAFT_52882 [Cercospora zeae-maydis SCOH1-5]|uniref:FAD/NAD(P)-binding domain-containing protein n=1 Tax=Cercospora zeae-maydis SCOH1-5 TaxID=717836 RepID=A0A6A6F211_9PEZI|nr:hypothetical protein CERZMDRAFT_52882 [Cercospora zeae-maydis SCOH1-5]